MAQLAIGRLDRLTDRDLEDLAARWFSDKIETDLNKPIITDEPSAIEEAEIELRDLLDSRPYASEAWVVGVTEQLLIAAGARTYRPKSTIVRRAKLDLDTTSPQFSFLKRLVKRGLLAATRITLARLDGRPANNHDHLFGDEPPQAAGRRSKTVDEAIRLFENDPSRKGSVKTKLDYAMVFRLLRECVDRDAPLSSVTREHCYLFRDTLTKLPPNATKKFAGRSLREIAAIASDAGHSALNPQTINSHLTKLGTFLKWATRERIVPSNEAESLRVTEARSDINKRTPFSDDQLLKIFNAPLYTGCVDDENGYAQSGLNMPRRARFWVPLISLFHGMRLNEICQLTLADIRIQEGILVFDIGDRSPGQTVKSASGHRIVPVHPIFFLIGFNDFIKRQANHGHDRLFPELARDGRGYYSDGFQKWFARFLASCDAKEKGTTFHSFRHGWVTKLRRKGVPEERRKLLGGWHRPGEEKGYGDNPVHIMAQDIASVEYPGLDLSHLYERN